MNRTVRVGITGAGYIGGRHARVLARLPGADLVGIADLDVERAGGLADAVGVRSYPDTASLLDDADLDALYVCVPPFAHGEPERLAIEHGVSLFVEKPLALDVALAEEIAESADRAGIVTAVGYHWRYLDTVDRARQLLAATPCHLALGAWLDRAPGAPWWGRAATSGGQLVEQATHIFDLARTLVGEVVAVQAVGARIDDIPAGDIDHVAAVLLRFDTGAVGTISTACVLGTGYRVGLELVCRERVLVVTEQELVVDDGSRREVTAIGVDPFVAEDRDFIADVRDMSNLGNTADVRDGGGGRNGGRRVRVPYAEALRTHRVAVAAARAARDQVTVDLGPVRA